MRKTEVKKVDGERLVCPNCKADEVGIMNSVVSAYESEKYYCKRCGLEFTSLDDHYTVYYAGSELTDSAKNRVKDIMDQIENNLDCYNHDRSEMLRAYISKAIDYMNSSMLEYALYVTFERIGELKSGKN